MFDQFGALMKLMGNKGKIQEELAAFQQRTGQITAEGSAGGGLVTVRVNGRLEMVGCKITDDAVKDRELLEDLVVAAANQAIGKVREQVADETKKMAGNLGLPPGLLGSIPGLG